MKRNIIALIFLIPQLVTVALSFRTRYISFLLLIVPLLLLSIVIKKIDDWNTKWGFYFLLPQTIGFGILLTIVFLTDHLESESMILYGMIFLSLTLVSQVGACIFYTRALSKASLKEESKKLN